MMNADATTAMLPRFLENQFLRIADRQLQKIRSGHLLVELPSGAQKHYGDNSPPRLLKINNQHFFSRLVMGGNTGLGEAWMDDDWTSDDLTGILELFIENMASLKATSVPFCIVKRLRYYLRQALKYDLIGTGKRNVHAHYDLGNDFYRTFLDHDTMMYSSAIFLSSDESLEQAQQHKIERLIKLAGIQPEHHVLEIGCGWGGFAIEAAKRIGCRVTGITTSPHQFKYAVERIEAEGLSDRVEIRMNDYRQVQGSFDRIVSIEMLESIGHSLYGSFFAACDRLLKPEGRVVLQVIAIPDQHYDVYLRNPDWIQKHMFPGGMLPSIGELTKAMARHSPFIVDHLNNIGNHYAETLRRWRKAFNENRSALIKMGYDGSFQRKWIYYLCYCEAGFQTRFINNFHMTLARPSESVA